MIQSRAKGDRANSPAIKTSQCPLSKPVVDYQSSPFTVVGETQEDIVNALAGQRTRRRVNCWL